MGSTLLIGATGGGPRGGKLSGGPVGGLTGGSKDVGRDKGGSTPGKLEVMGLGAMGSCEVPELTGDVTLWCSGGPGPIPEVPDGGNIRS